MGDVMLNEANIFLWLAGQLIVGAAIWGGIRADIRGMHLRIEQTERSMRDAHSRIDNFIERRANDKT